MLMHGDSTEGLLRLYTSMSKSNDREGSKSRKKLATASIQVTNYVYTSNVGLN